MRKRDDELTSRQQDVLNLIYKGRSAKQIGQELHITTATAERHTQNIFSRLGVSSRVQAVVTAICKGLLNPGKDT